jgi:hypothetical protein
MKSGLTPFSGKLNYLILIFIIMILFSGCKSEKKAEGISMPESEVDNSIPIVTEVMDFIVTDSISSGWQTFKYVNNSREPHFVLFEKYPAGFTITNAQQEVVPVFQNGMNLLNQGKTDEAMAAFGTLPDWFPKIEFLGGTGIISPGETATTTLNMKPGYYVIECYVKMENGVFHSAMGMLEDLVVTTDSVDFSPPAASVTVEISKDGGLNVLGSIKGGEQVFAVNFLDQAPHEHFIGHDVNLVRLGEGANPDSLANWMNWSDPKGLIAPGPKDVTFLGGVNEMPAGHTGYFKATLTPGEYALISEVPSPREKKMFYAFSVEKEVIR